MYDGAKILLMPKELINISQLNRQITINKFVFAQQLDQSNEGYGGNIKALSLSYTMMAYFEPVSSSYTLEQFQVNYGELYKCIIRFEHVRTLLPNDEINYNGKVWKMQGAPVISDERGKRFLTFYAKTSNTQSNFSAPTQQLSMEYHYIATGGERSFSMPQQYSGWPSIIVVFRDKRQYSVIRSGIP